MKPPKKSRSFSFDKFILRRNFLCEQLIFFSVYITSCLILATHLPLAHAQQSGIEEGEEATTNPKDRSIQVSAVVIEQGTLEAAELIQPTHNSITRDNTPTFIWRDPALKSLVVNFILLLDDVQIYELGIVSQTTLDYELFFDGANQYSLTPSDSLSDGTYTWKIVSKDAKGNQVGTTKWSFTIDTRPPDFAIKRIEDIETNMVTGNQTSVPATPFEITDNDPEFKGESDPHDYVEVVITLADGTTLTDEFTVGEDGRWNRVFSNLPRGQVIQFDFTITDLAGNTSKLERVMLFIASPELFVPIPAIIIPPSLLPSEEPPAIIIPLVTPEIVIEKIVSKLPPFIVTPATYLTATLRISSSNWLMLLQKIISNWLVLIFLSALTGLQVLLLAMRWRKYLNPELWKSILMVVGLIPDERPQGIAVNHSTQDPIAYGLITFFGQASNKRIIKVHRITNKHGIFFDVSLPDGIYRASFEHPNFLFPVLQSPPKDLDQFQFYTGREFQIKKKPLSMFGFFATPRLVANSSLHWFHHIIAVEKLSPPIWTINLLITLVLPSFGNLAVTIIFTLGWIWKTYQLHQIGLEGHTVTPNQEPIAKTILSIVDNHGSPLEITQSNQSGNYCFHSQQTDYHLHITDVRFKLAEPNKTQALTAHVTPTDQYHPLILTEIN